MDAGRIINIKLGRVGGFAEAKRVHDVAQAAGIPVWCGGMLEAGIGRAHNIALATLPNFTLPGDVSASKRYWSRDIIQPPVEIDAARNHSGARRARLRVRTRPRIPRSITDPPGIHFVDGRVRRASEERTATIATPGPAKWSAKSAIISTTSPSSALALANTRSGLVVTGIMLSRAIPAVMAGPVAGVVLDRLDRKRIMIASDLIRAVVALGFILAIPRSRHLAAVFAQRAADVRFAVLHQRPLGDSSHHREQRRAAHRQFTHPDHAMDDADHRGVPGRHQRRAVRL